MNDPDLTAKMLNALVGADLISHELSVTGAQEDPSLDEGPILDLLFDQLPQPVLRLDTGRYGVRIETSEQDVRDAITTALPDLGLDLRRIDSAQSAGYDPQVIHQLGAEMADLKGQIKELTEQFSALTPIRDDIEGISTATNKVLEGLATFSNPDSPDLAEQVTESLKQALETLPPPVVERDDPMPLDDIRDLIDARMGDDGLFFRALTALQAQVDQLATADPPDVTEQIEAALARRLDPVVTAITAAGPGDEPSTDGVVARIEEQISQITARVPDLADIAPQLGQINETLDSIADRLRLRADRAMELERMALTRGTLAFETILRRMGAATQTLEDSLENHITTLEARTAQVVAMVNSATSGTDLATIGLQVKDLTKAVEAMPQPAPMDMPSLDPVVAEIRSLAQSKVQSIDLNEERQGIARLSVALQSVMRRLDTQVTALEKITQPAPVDIGEIQSDLAAILSRMDDPPVGEFLPELKQIMAEFLAHIHREMHLSRLN